MKTGLSTVATIAEIVASIGVVVSLIFVGVQLEQGNKETRAATIQAVLKAEMDMVAILIENSDTWDRVIAGESLESGGETRRGINLFNLVMLESANRYSQYRAGYLDESNWQNTQEVLPQLKRLPIYSMWRESPGGRGQARDFLALLDRI